MAADEKTRARLKALRKKHGLGEFKNKGKAVSKKTSPAGVLSKSTTNPNKKKAPRDPKTRKDTSAHFPGLNFFPGLR